MKHCTLLFTLTMQNMMGIDKVRTRTLLASLILLRKTQRLVRLEYVDVLCVRFRRIQAALSS